MTICGKNGRGGVALLAGLASLCAASGQTLMKSGANGPMLMGNDMAVFEAHDTRDDLPCQVVPSKPVLGFDLKFHAGFDISVPLKELAGSENTRKALVHQVSRLSRRPAVVHAFVEQMEAAGVSL